jgi:hypothetical protein
MRDVVFRRLTMKVCMSSEMQAVSLSISRNGDDRFL